MNFIWLHNNKIYNSGYSTEIVNEQCNTGDPLETSGGLYRGPPSILIYVNTIIIINLYFRLVVHTQHKLSSM